MHTYQSTNRKDIEKTQITYKYIATIQLIYTSRCPAQTTLHTQATVNTEKTQNYHSHTLELAIQFSPNLRVPIDPTDCILK